jgi:hypothetical protein
MTTETLLKYTNFTIVITDEKNLLSIYRDCGFSQNVFTQNRDFFLNWILLECALEESPFAPTGFWPNRFWQNGFRQNGFKHNYCFYPTGFMQNVFRQNVIWQNVFWQNGFWQNRLRQNHVFAPINGTKNMCQISYLGNTLLYCEFQVCFHSRFCLNPFCLSPFCLNPVKAKQLVILPKFIRPESVWSKKFVKTHSA